jgi:hypothetical protein
MTSPVVQGVESSFSVERTFTKITTLMTSFGSSTSAEITVLFGVQEPQKILFADTETDTNPGPGRDGVAGMTGVAVSIPIKIGIGSNVAVGILGSNVGRRTMVAVAVGSGVFVGTGVSIGV